MAILVYSLCAITSLGCAFLLFRGYLQRRTELLLLSAFCFLGLGINNVILFLDFIVVPMMDLSMMRTGVALLGCVILLVGLIWDTAG